MTPSMALSVWVRNMLLMGSIIWISTLIITRIYTFHEAYSKEVINRTEERYLLEKCKVPPQIPPPPPPRMHGPG